jgi:hypothetical protein
LTVAFNAHRLDDHGGIYAHLLAAAYSAANTFPWIVPGRTSALRLGAASRRAGMFPEGGIRVGPTSILGGVAPKRGRPPRGWRMFPHSVRDFRERSTLRPA